MKIFILKLLSLFVFILGLISLLVVLGVPQVQDYLARAPEWLAELRKSLPEPLAFLRGALTVQGLWFGASVAAIVLGIYGLFPQFAKYRRRKRIAYEGPHGEVQIQLDSVEQSLNQILARMPEIRKIDLRVDPHEGGRKALIRANVVLNQQPGQNARAIAALVSDYISETAQRLMGLEEPAKIDLHVVGLHMNTRKSSKAIRKDSLSHSSNAPVELLEAPPAPLPLSGPGDPLGSEPIEEEIEEEEAGAAGGSMDTNAVDTRKDEANQAAARSELLEPLHLGEAAGAHAHEEGAASHAEETPVAPRDMDVLDEALEEEDDEAEFELDEGEELGEAGVLTEESDETGESDETEESRDVEMAAETEDAAESEAIGETAESEDAEATLDVPEDAAAADEPEAEGDEPGTVAGVDASAMSESAPVEPEPAEEFQQEVGPSGSAYPWEQPRETTEEALPVAEDPGDEIPEAAEEPSVTVAGDEEEAEASDSVLGDAPGEVVIPEPEGTDESPEDATESPVEAEEESSFTPEASPVDAEEASPEAEASPGEPEAKPAEVKKKGWSSWFS